MNSEYYTHYTSTVHIYLTLYRLESGYVIVLLGRVVYYYTLYSFIPDYIENSIINTRNIEEYSLQLQCTILHRRSTEQNKSYKTLEI